MFLDVRKMNLSPDELARYLDLDLIDDEAVPYAEAIIENAGAKAGRNFSWAHPRAEALREG